MQKILESCYKLLWNENDNANGWIEPTTRCNLKCPGCYRGADKDDHIPYTLSLEEVKSQIDWFIENRNIHTLSISGGEPLLYKHINEVVEYATSKKLRTMIYTNGLSLTEKKLKELKDAGATQFLVHADKYQERPDIKDEMTVNDLQQKFCDLFRKVNGPLLGFIQPLSTNNYIADIERITNISQKNTDIVSLNVFTLYKDVCWEPEIKQKISVSLTMKEVVEAFAENNGFIPATYLPSEFNQFDPTWIFGTRVGTKNQNFGYFEPKLLKLTHEKYRKRTGKHMFISRRNNVKMLGLLKLLNYKSIRKIWSKYLFSKKSPVYFQTVLLLRGPEKNNEKEWDLCKGCPDRIIYNGRLVPSCILEDLKNKSNEKFKKVEFKS
ncbi:MAG: radical SAM protein [Bacteroidales bacterium]|nr:radical SAM protein [Bacteroidales bacterium]